VPILQANGAVAIRIGGHTDERGSDEYNLALGQRRAAAAKLRTPALVAFVGRGQADLTTVTQDVLAAVGAQPVRPAEWPAPYDRVPRTGLLRGFFSGGRRHGLYGARFRRARAAICGRARY